MLVMTMFPFRWWRAGRSRWRDRGAALTTPPQRDLGRSPHPGQEAWQVLVRRLGEVGAVCGVAADLDGVPHPLARVGPAHVDPLAACAGFGGQLAGRRAELPLGQRPAAGRHHACSKSVTGRTYGHGAHSTEPPRNRTLKSCTAPEALLPVLGDVGAPAPGSLAAVTSRKAGRQSPLQWQRRCRTVALNRLGVPGPAGWLRWHLPLRLAPPHVSCRPAKATAASGRQPMAPAP